MCRKTRIHENKQRKETEILENGPETIYGQSSESLGDHVCQKWDILELQMTMGRTGAP